MQHAWDAKRGFGFIQPSLCTDATWRLLWGVDNGDSPMLSEEWIGMCNKQGFFDQGESVRMREWKETN